MQTLLELAYRSQLPGRFGVALFALRVFVGVAFILHGFGRIRDLRGFAADYHISPPAALAAKATQILGGLMLIVGLLTPVAALGVFTVMVVATRILIVKGEAFINPRGHSWEVCALYALVGLVIALVGPGPLSVDALLFFPQN